MNLINEQIELLIKLNQSETKKNQSLQNIYGDEIIEGLKALELIEFEQVLRLTEKGKSIVNEA
ncbi:MULTISPECIES: hypothetical protein [Paenibacillus]|uniref:Uncharacterized protein n=2 Tax=Paenibacillus TaxID=44249 RepID=A0ABX2ZHZ4_PAEPO|nr:MULTISPECIES: hypothetical protein [Paenibacillus]MDR6779416.1 hypothetical protein [Paenibacillus peoriae]ODA08308.1 hypothetical protein A7312_27615 [Paenibacillus polymyxa]